MADELLDDLDRIDEAVDGGARVGALQPGELRHVRPPHDLVGDDDVRHAGCRDDRALLDGRGRDPPGAAHLDLVLVELGAHRRLPVRGQVHLVMPGEVAEDSEVLTHAGVSEGQDGVHQVAAQHVPALLPHVAEPHRPVASGMPLVRASSSSARMSCIHALPVIAPPDKNSAADHLLLSTHRLPFRGGRPQVRYASRICSFRRSSFASPGQRHLAVLQDVAAIGERQRHVGVLLDEQHRHAVLPVELPDRPELLVDVSRCESHRGRVHDEHAGVGHERAGDRQHLPLAPAEETRRSDAAAPPGRGRARTPAGGRRRRRGRPTSGRVPSGGSRGPSAP